MTKIDKVVKEISALWSFYNKSAKIRASLRKRTSKKENKLPPL